MTTTAEAQAPNPFPSLPLDQHWTIAYRKRTGPVFHRVTNWSGTWQQAFDMANKFGQANPDLQVWYVTTLAYEQAEREAIAAGTLVDHGYSEDWGNILTDGRFVRGTWTPGKRVKIVDNGTLPAELGGSETKPAPAAKTQRVLDLAAKRGLRVEEHEDTNSGQTFTARSWVVKNADDPRGIWGRLLVHEMRWRDRPGHANLSISYLGFSGKTRKVTQRQVGLWLAGMVK